MTAASAAPPAATVGTAGHVDHGKSTLVHALTGIDPDRLAEEKARGMTIDLGFAWLTLPSGRSVSLVDVPGHERFIHNMLAGVGGIDACLFVVAADEGVMPQTREHLDIVTLLGIERGVVALAKTDLVDEEWLDLVEQEVRETLAASSLAQAPIVPVSARDGCGLDALLDALDALLAQPLSRPQIGGPRLPVDRAFTQRGFGTVVTGTLAGGPLDVGDMVHLYPGGARTRVRGLQTHRAAEDRAWPGRRVAVNLGGIAPADVPRGTVVAAPGAATETRRVDATLRLLPSAPRALKPGERVSWHSGTAEVVAALRYLEADPIQPGSAGWVQWRLGEAVAIRKGDPYVIRRLSPPMTIGGGEIVRAAARHVPRGDRDALEALERARRAPPAELVAAAVEAGGPLTPVEIARRTELSLDQVTALVAEVERAGGLSVVGGYAAPAAVVDALRRRIRARLSPRAAAGLSRAALPQELGAPAPLVAALLEGMAEQGRLVLKEGRVLPPGQSAAPHGPEADRFLAALDQGGFAPPDLPALARSQGASSALLDALATAGELVRITPTFGLTQAGYARWREAIGEAFAASDQITVKQLRDQLGTSRKYVLAFLEHLDAQAVTRRVGEARILLDRSWLPE
ncbi:MAG: selenocysteine-specific translation elongation factor [Chloroflexi bacterium]|nr:selenocysteine-specific translation elongation factor [Chloroflexota bacterium]